jgi:hypothetical protein
MDDSAAHFQVAAADKGDYFLGNSLDFQQFPQCLFVYTVERLLIGYEVDVEREFHSSDCSTMMRRLAIWSEQDLFLQKPVC